MIPTWLLTIWHMLSIASAVVVLGILCWKALRRGPGDDLQEEIEMFTDEDEEILDRIWARLKE
ncbi:MAG: hypothetical protein VB817_11225 [Pirellulaceae bacterium]